MFGLQDKNIKNAPDQKSRALENKELWQWGVKKRPVTCPGVPCLSLGSAPAPFKPLRGEVVRIRRTDSSVVMS